MEIDIEKLLKAVAGSLDLSKFRGDVAGVKIVNQDNRIEIGTVEAGGIAVQNVYYGSERAPEREPAPECEEAPERGRASKGERAPMGERAPEEKKDPEGEGESSKQEKAPKRDRPHGSEKGRARETMTFGRKSGVLDAHLTMLYSKLTSEGWIEGNEADFRALFSGRRDADCELTWTGAYGKPALVALFRALIDEGFVTLERNFYLSNVLEGHFRDREGHWLRGLAKGNRPNAKVLPVIRECLRLMATDLRASLLDADADCDCPVRYDPFDHQDLHLHRR